MKDIVLYADIAADLGQFGLAAMVYWNVATSVKSDDDQKRLLIEYMLYCLDQLGEKSLKRNFKGDHAAEFAHIDAERSRRRSESAAKRIMRK